MNRIDEINKRLHELLPTTDYKIDDYKEESFKWASNYQEDVKYLLEENNRLKEERDSFQRVGINEMERFMEFGDLLTAIIHQNGGEIKISSHTEVTAPRFKDVIFIEMQDHKDLSTILKLGKK